MFILAVWTLALLLCGPGCTGGVGRPVKTEGSIVLEGKPVAGATVTFHPEKKEQGRVATGLTDEDGVFQLQTFASDDGALPGDYRVTVIKTEALAAPPVAGDREKHKEWMMKTMFNRSKPKSRATPLPKEYADPATTPLRVHVPSEGQVRFELRKVAGP
jgi:hypothetical protein